MWGGSSPERNKLEWLELHNFLTCRGRGDEESRIRCPTKQRYRISPKSATKIFINAIKFSFVHLCYPIKLIVLDKNIKAKY